MRRAVTTILWASIMCLCSVSSAQIYFPITHLTGTQNINGVDITVSSTPLGTGVAPYCDAGPYHIGAADVPGSYTFIFSTPVGNVKIQSTAQNSDEIISFIVNGVPYFLTASDLSFYGTTCNQPQAIALGGNLAAPGTPIRPGAGTEINISNVSSIEISANGVQQGTVFSIAFGGIYVHSNSPVCQGDTLKLFTVPDKMPGATYSWTGPRGFSSNVPNPVLPTVAMDYEGMYVATVTSPTDTLTDSIYVAILPTPFTKIVYNEPVCEGTDLELSDTTTLPGISYHWQGANGFSSSTSHSIISNVQSLHSGLYSLTTTLGKCSYTAEANIQILKPSYYGFTKVICANEPFDFYGSLLSSPGMYQHILTAANGCDSVLTLDLIVLPIPEISLSVYQGKKPLCIGDTVLCKASGASVYEWFKDDFLLGSSNTVHVYLPDFTNDVLVVGWSDNNCRNTSKLAINASACCDMFIPSAFSPNGDGNNDDFGPVPHGNVKGYNMRLFNRWGQQVFSAIDIDSRWDGVYNGVAADIGTYYYYITAECLGLDGKEMKRKGDVVLLR